MDEGVGVLDERIGNKKRDRDEEEGKMGRLEKRPSGMMFNVIEEYSYSGDEMINGVKYEEEKMIKTTSDTGPGPGPGLLNQFLTNLVSSPKSNHKVESHHEEGTTEGSSGGGGFKHMISNMFTGNGGEEVVVVDGGGSEKEKEGDDNGGSGSVIDNIVAQLPRTLSEDRVPATDEASILIHSIIHD